MRTKDQANYVAPVIAVLSARGHVNVTSEEVQSRLDGSCHRFTADDHYAVELHWLDGSWLAYDRDVYGNHNTYILTDPVEWIETIW